jgi:hypothetical protein
MLAEVLPPAGLPRRLATQSAIYAISATSPTGSAAGALVVRPVIAWIARTPRNDAPLKTA